MTRKKLNKYGKRRNDNDEGKKDKSKDESGVCNSNFANVKETGQHFSGATVCSFKTYKANKNAFKMYVHGGWNGQHQLVYSDYLKDNFNNTYVKASVSKILENEHITRLFIKTGEDNTITKHKNGKTKTYYHACDSNSRGLYIVRDHSTSKRYLRALPGSKLTGEECPLYVRTTRSGYVYSLRSLCGFSCGFGDGYIYFRVDDNSPCIIATITSHGWNYLSPQKLYLKLQSIATKDAESDLRSHPVSN